jgi:hypothetical protein
MLNTDYKVPLIHILISKGNFSFPMPKVISPFSLINNSISIGHLPLALLEATSPGFILRLKDIGQSDILDDLSGVPRKQSFSL